VVILRGYGRALIADGLPVGLEPCSSCVEHLDLGMRPDVSFDRIQEGSDLPVLTGDGGESEFGALPLVLESHLCCGHPELRSAAVDEMLDHGSLLLEGPC